MNNNQSEQDINAGLGASKAIGKTALNTGKKLAQNAGKEAVSKSLLSFLVSNPTVLAIGAFIVFLLLMIMLITISFSSSTLFNDTEPDMGEVRWALYDGYETAKKNSIDYVSDYIDELYPSFNIKRFTPSYEYEKGYTYSYDNDSVAYDFTIKFAPDLDEFAGMVNAYANGVNGAISYFMADEEANNINEDTNYTPPSNVLDFDEETGNFTTADSTLTELDKYDSEYANSQGDDFFYQLSHQSYSLFHVEQDTGRWDINLRETQKRKTREIRSCSYEIKGKGRVITGSMSGSCPVSNSYITYTEHVDTEVYYIPYLTGSVTVFMNCEYTNYKLDVVNKMKSDLVGQEFVLEQRDPEGNRTYEKKILDAQYADMMVEEAINNYFASYLSTYNGYSYVGGYPGAIDLAYYSNTARYPGGSVGANQFWARAISNAELRKLPYAKFGVSGGGYAANYNCTQFAAQFFYDLYGFSALRGNGVNQADNLLVDCGVGTQNACPVQFERAYSPAPGAIVSLYPNHVITIVAVNNDGSIVMADGNNDHKGGIATGQKYSSLNDYCRKYGVTVKTIAIPESLPE